ncbi:MAG: hypothetical protein JOY99_06830 [Sphingomonadaceae bacterium]|nr:hypothetical protein [Sphingomonadaceae bacterium]
MTDFYDVGAVARVAINLFNGYGYNFYREENQLRADDQRIRALAGSLLAQARASLAAAEGDYRRTNIPPPTREKPFPDPAVTANAQAIERLSSAVGGLEGQIRHQPVPENDRMTQRYRKEAETLEALGEKDKALVGQAELLRALLAGLGGDAVLQRKPEIEQGIAAIGETLRGRAMLLA